MAIADGVAATAENFNAAFASKYLTVSSSITSTYSVLTTDQFLKLSASGGSFTATLHTAVGYAGKEIYLTRTDQTLANAVTIATTGGQTIGGASTVKLCTQYETIALVSDGSNWLVSFRRIPNVLTAYTPTWGASTSNPSIGDGTVSGLWRRVGECIEAQIEVVMGSTTTYGTGTYTFSLPSGLSIDTSKTLLDTSQTVLPGGGALFDSSGSAVYDLKPYYSSSTIRVRAWNAAGSFTSQTDLTGTSVVTLAQSDAIRFIVSVPITNWEG